MDREEIRGLVAFNLGKRTDKDSLINSAINLSFIEIQRKHVFSEQKSTPTDLTLTSQDGWVVDTDYETDDITYYGYVFYQALSDHTSESTSEPGEGVSWETYWTDLGSFYPGTTHVVLPTSFKILEARLWKAQTSGVIKIKSKTWVGLRYPQFPAIAAGLPIYGYLEGGNLYLLPVIGSSGYKVRLTIATVITPFTQDTDESDVSNIDDVIINYATYWSFKSMKMYQDAAVWWEGFKKSLREAIINDERQPAVEYQAHRVTDVETRTPGPKPHEDPFNRG